jgi:hypothetical protein
MNIRPKLRRPLLAAALAVSAVSAWAIGNSTLVPGPAAPPRQDAALEPKPLASEPPGVANEQGLAPNEEVVKTEQAVTEERPILPRQPAAAPMAEAPPRAPAITVEEQRLTVDQRIQADVIDLLARNPNLSGRIGVVSNDSVVTLTGYTTTSGMAWRAGRDARGVQGVRHVVNEIRPRVGGITS